MFRNPYPDKTYLNKMIRITKNLLPWILAIGFIVGLYIATGAEQSLAGKLSIKGYPKRVVKCIRNGTKLVWTPNPKDKDIDYYLVFSARKITRINSKSDLETRNYVARTLDPEWTLPKKHRKRLYFYTVQAIDKRGQKSEPAKPISCLQER